MLAPLEEGPHEISPAYCRSVDHRICCRQPHRCSRRPELGPDVQPFVDVPAGKIAITHVRIIDGTGAPAVEDQTLLIDGAKIAAVPAGECADPAGYHMIDGKRRDGDAGPRRDA